MRASGQLYSGDIVSDYHADKPSFHVHAMHGSAYVRSNAISSLAVYMLMTVINQGDVYATLIQ
ncbi:MAG TPA: hypothetical protein ACQGQG_06890 [Xylella sp.]